MREDSSARCYLCRFLSFLIEVYRTTNSNAQSPNASPLLLPDPKFNPLVTRNHCTVLLQVCDINLAPRYTLPILTRVMRALRPGGLVVFTGKFQGAGDHAGGYIDFIRTALPQLRGTKCLWLLANTTHERTYIGWKRADGDAVARPDIGPTTFIRNSVSTSAEGTSDPSDRLQGPDEVSNRTRRDADKPGAGGNELATGVPIKSEVTEDGKFVILKKSWPFRIVL